MRVFFIFSILVTIVGSNAHAEGNIFKGTSLEDEFDDWGGTRCTRYEEFYGPKSKATDAYLAAEDGSRAQCEAIKMEAAAKPPMLEYFRSDPSCKGYRRVDIELENYHENLQHHLFDLYCGKFGEPNPYKLVASEPKSAPAACGTQAGDQKSFSIEGTVGSTEENEVDGKSYTYAYIAECDELEIILPAKSECDDGSRLSATGTFWWCGDDGTYSDGVECLYEHALEVTKFSCSR